MTLLTEMDIHIIKTKASVTPKASKKRRKEKTSVTLELRQLGHVARQKKKKKKYRSVMDVRLNNNAKCYATKQEKRKKEKKAKLPKSNGFYRSF